MDNIKKLWEERGRKYGRDMKGVLPKSFPYWLNKILHNWMYEQVRYEIRDTRYEKILDLGCGYGRIAKEILKDFPGAKVYGVDVSKTYVGIFNKDLGPGGHAIVTDIRKLPFTANYFDFAFMITTLMYITDKKEQEITMKEIFRVLKPKGRFVFVERNPTGHSLFTFGGLITKLRGKKHREIKSVSFNRVEMIKLVHSAEGVIEKESGFPFGILLTPSLYISYSGYKT